MKISYDKFIFFIFIFFSISILSGCSRSDQREFVKSEMRKIDEQVKNEKMSEEKSQVLIPIKPVQYVAEENTSGKLNDTQNEKLKGTVFYYSLSKFQFLGSILDKNIYWAYIMDPTGHVYQVKLGDHLGKENATVTNIGSTSVEFQVDDRKIVITKG